MALDYLAHQHQVTWTAEKKLHGWIGRFKAHGQSITLLKPNTYMNLSGQAVVATQHYYKIAPEQTLIVYDDTALPFGRLRFRASGSAGSHNGMKSIIEQVGVTTIPRLRLGIDDRPSHIPLKAYVLAKFTEAERDKLAKIFDQSAQAMLDWISQGTDTAANRWNGQWLIDPPPAPVIPKDKPQIELPQEPLSEK